jgi:hypothetical protein
MATSDTFVLIACATAGLAAILYFRSRMSPTPAVAYEGESLDMTGSSLLAEASNLQRACGAGDSAACVDYATEFDQNVVPEAQNPYAYKF